MSENIYNVEFDNTQSNFDPVFNETVVVYRNVESMSVDQDGTIHLYLSTGQEMVFPEIKNLFARVWPLVDAIEITD